MHGVHRVCIGQNWQHRRCLLACRGGVFVMGGCLVVYWAAAALQLSRPNATCTCHLPPTCSCCRACCFFVVLQSRNPLGVKSCSGVLSITSLGQLKLQQTRLQRLKELHRITLLQQLKQDSLKHQAARCRCDAACCAAHSSNAAAAQQHRAY